MFRWLEDFQQQSDASADAQVGARIKDIRTRSPQSMSRGNQLKKPQQLDSPKYCKSPCVSTPSPTSKPEEIVTARSRGTTGNGSLSDEQLQELVVFLVYIQSDRPQKPDQCDETDVSPTASEGGDLGCEDDLDLSAGQLKALRKKLEDSRMQECDSNSKADTSEFGDCPAFADDCGLSDEQFLFLSLYYHWYKDTFAADSAGGAVDFGLPPDKLHKLRSICEDDVTSSASTGIDKQHPQDHICEYGLSDANLQNLVWFNKWILSKQPSMNIENEIGLSFDQLVQIKQYYGWCQKRRKIVPTHHANSGLSEEQLEKHLARLSAPQVPFTDQQIQDLVFLFIWSGAAFDFASMEGCDDDIDLEAKQLAQLKRKCAELAGQGRHALSSDAELKELAEAIDIEQEQLQTLIQYSAWSSSPEAQDVALSAEQLTDIRGRCKLQHAACSGARLQEHTSMSKDSAVSDERLQNLVRFYNWRSNTLGATECDLDDGFGLSDELFGELIRYLVWCERRAMATSQMSPLDHDVSYSHQNTASASLPQNATIVSKFNMQPVHENKELEAMEQTDCSFNLSESEASTTEVQPMNPRRGDLAHTRSARDMQPKPLSPASDSSVEGRCMTAKELGRPAKQPAGKSAARVGTPPRSPSPVKSSFGKSLPTSSVCSDKMKESTMERENSFDSQGSAPGMASAEKRGSSWNAISKSKLPDLQQQDPPVSFSIYTESESEITSPSHRGKLGSSCERVSGYRALDKGDVGVDVGTKQGSNSAQQAGSSADSVTEDPIVAEFLAKSQAPACSASTASASLSSLNLFSPQIPLTTNGGVPFSGGQRVASPATAQQRQCRSPMGENAGNHSSTVLVGNPEIAFGSPDMEAEMKRFIWRTVLEGCPAPDNARHTRGRLQRDEFSDDDSPSRRSQAFPPRASKSRGRGTFQGRARGSQSPCRGAQTFCVAPQPAETWGWDTSTWWPSRQVLLDRLMGKCSSGDDEQGQFEELHADH